MIKESIEIEKIIVEPRIRPLNDKYVSNLVDSIRKFGLIQPITVLEYWKNKRYILVDGLHRLEACKKLNTGYINVISTGLYSEKYGPASRSTLEVESNIARYPLSLEEIKDAIVEQNKQLKFLRKEPLKRDIQEINIDNSYSIAEDLRITDIMTFSEAAELYNLDSSTLRKLVKTNKLVEGIDYRKSGSVWLITKKAMERVYAR